jgi:hypothetical protein
MALDGADQQANTNEQGRQFDGEKGKHAQGILQLRGH